MNHQLNFHEKPELLLQKLIQFNTSNPPGNEKACIQFIEKLLLQYGIESEILYKDENRPNLIARLKGEGETSPIMLYGHVDVVTTENQSWTHPPFSGEIIDGVVWGRGALDMKGGVAMMIAAFLKAKVNKIPLSGDVLLVILSDEEAGGDYGAKFLVEEHPSLFKDIQYAIGEFGGFTLYIADKRFYPIMVAEKKICWMKLVIKGKGGHAALPIRDEAMAKLSKLLKKLNNRMPVHITPEVKLMLEGISNHMPPAKKMAIKQLLNPRMTNFAINRLGEHGELVDSLLHNTVAPTIIRTTEKVNVIPSEIEVELDGRVLPGFSEEDYLKELKQLINDDSIEVEVVRSDIAHTNIKMQHFYTLADIINEYDPDGIPIPFILPGVTDGRHFARLGIQTYGFLPMNLPPEINVARTIHTEDERIPVESLFFGMTCIYKTLQTF
ncbi:M20/M25/M40 family metallo-hydrolase [Evansella sp. AB-P1]|uniref:M20/M25/M40 family metallo-hydrolase n=1 Tax=Evansella sp. AB-P1 TaxID=3037653 RepID=UPI00241DE3B2|nr:M20/M25/M40 family metallo-hydrolase [Evansella sp. AB-P1]MDG5787264.1 M20/M25/M40 family metallo-hydrolase [Evansella sp. AB-P1]